jgi:hypothetical protein
VPTGLRAHPPRPGPPPLRRRDIKYHYIWELVDAKTVADISVGTSDMLEDGMTKALPEPKHKMIFKRCMGAAPSGDLFACITANDLEGLL